MILPRNVSFELLSLDVGRVALANLAHQPRGETVRATMAVSERSTVTVSKLIETYWRERFSSGSTDVTRQFPWAVHTIGLNC